MNRIRAERRRSAARWAIGGAVAGAVLGTVGTLVVALPVGLLVAVACLSAGAWRGFEALTSLPPMLPGYEQEHVELRRLLSGMAGDLKLLPEVIDEMEDLLEVDAQVRSRASANVERIRRIFDHAAREGRVGVLDRLKGGWRTASGGDAVSELQFMMNTLRTVLDREISDLIVAVAGATDPELRKDREATLSALQKQRDAIDRQSLTLKQRDASFRKTRESLRAVELQLANLSDLEHEELQRVAGELTAGIRSQVDLLEEALGEMHGLGSSPEPKKLD